MMSFLAILLEMNKPKAIYLFGILFILAGLILGSIYLTRYCSIRMKELRSARNLQDDMPREQDESRDGKRKL